MDQLSAPGPSAPPDRPRAGVHGPAGRAGAAGSTGSAAGPTPPRAARGGPDRGAGQWADRREAGYTYASAMIAAAGLAIAAQTASIPAASERLRDAEAELIFRGEAYRRAVASYWAAGPERALPREMADLLDDPRADGLRHIRRLYAPTIGGPWTVLRSEDGGIEGVAPSSEEAPRRRSFFPPGLGAFEGAETYADWAFRFDPEAP